MNVKDCKISSEFAAEVERLTKMFDKQLLAEKHSNRVVTGRKASHFELREVLDHFKRTDRRK